MQGVSDPYNSQEGSFQNYQGTHSDRVSACREVFHLVRNAIIGYQYEVGKLVVGNLNLLRNIITFVNPDKQIPSRLTEHALHVLQALFAKERESGSQDFYAEFQSMGGIDMIEEQKFSNQQCIYDLATNIIQTYGDGEAYIIQSADGGVTQAHNSVQT